MKALFCHSYVETLKRPDFLPNFMWPRIEKGQKKKDCGQLDIGIPKPQWLVDPAHRTKVVTKRFFEIKKEGKAHSSITTADCL
eukprot:5037713-Ditylum_brightwellii.AAC.1